MAGKGLLSPWGLRLGSHPLQPGLSTPVLLGSLTGSRELLSGGVTTAGGPLSGKGHQMFPQSSASSCLSAYS